MPNLRASICVYVLLFLYGSKNIRWIHLRSEIQLPHLICKIVFEMVRILWRHSISTKLQVIYRDKRRHSLNETTNRTSLINNVDISARITLPDKTSNIC